MIESSDHAPNPTAVAVAHCRAVESAHEQPLLNDPFASQLVELAGVPFSELSLAEVTTNRLISSVAIRSHFIDAAVTATESPQIVCLGLGLDTRPWRLDDRPRRWFGVDRGSTVDFMRTHMPAISPSPAGTIKYVTADLTDPMWKTRLVDAGFDPQTSTTWILEGVTMYLSDDENRQLLDDVADLSAPGSSLVTVGFGLGSVDEAQSAEVAARAARSGNTFRSIIDDPASWLGSSWAVKAARSFADYGTELGRPLPYDEDPARPVSWLIDARRL